MLKVSKDIITFNNRPISDELLALILKDEVSELNPNKEYIIKLIAL